MSCDCRYILEKDAVEEQHYADCTSRQTNGPKLRDADGTLRLNNKHLKDLQVDYLYHLGLDTNSDLEGQFGDVKFVCLGGKKSRMRSFIQYIGEVLKLHVEEKPVDLIKHSGRYAMYKCGPVLAISHGIGIPSMTTVLQEVLKLMHYAKAVDPVFLRIGSSGGLSVPAGSVVISSWGLSGTLKKAYEIPVMGEIRSTPSYLDKRLAQELYSLSNEKDKEFKTYIAGTMGADDFYRGQARLDGPFCHYEDRDKMAFLQKLVAMGVRNIEMEATAFAAMTSEAGVRAGIVCVTFVDRLHGDQVKTPKNMLEEWEKRPMLVVARLIKRFVCQKSELTQMDEYDELHL